MRSFKIDFRKKFDKVFNKEKNWMIIFEDNILEELSNFLKNISRYLH